MRPLKGTFELHFQILSSTRYLSFLRQLLRSLKLSPEGTNRCSVALVEAVDNAIFHAYKGDRNKVIDIGIAVRGKRVVMEVGDSGGGFNLGDVRGPTLFQVNGRGLYIISSLMDRVEYKKNTLRMVYNPPSAPL